MSSPEVHLVRWTRWALATLLAASVWLPGRAAAGSLFADLDRDGVGDVVTVQPSPATGLRVWLSGSRSSVLLPTRRPVLGVVVVDLDGDGHNELVASDTSARVHVWRKSSRGGLRPTRPRAPSGASGVARSGQLTAAPDPSAGGLLVSGDPTPDADAEHPAWADPIHTAAAAICDAAGRLGTGHAALHHLRGPPAG